MKPIIECVPNFSEGEDETTIAAIAAAIKSVEGVQLLHQDSGKAANRTVYTFAGEVHLVFEAAYRAIAVAVERIDMRKQNGEHPRIGACDVCPFIPISGISLKELIPLTKSFAEKVNRDFNIPIYLYEESASSEKRKNLAKHRQGQYEGLEKRIKSGKWLPDYGSFNPKFGGCVMGARNFLVAYNINLNTTNAKTAQEIAYDLRELGRPIGKENGKTIYKPGKLK
ncbi:MAG: glutamate formimidoyltransferase, partial [Vicingaceae bacterium]